MTMMMMTRNGYLVRTLDKVEDVGWSMDDACAERKGQCTQSDGSASGVFAPIGVGSPYVFD